MVLRLSLLSCPLYVENLFGPGGADLRTTRRLAGRSVLPEQAA
jgi:hypothetical protein